MEKHYVNWETLDSKCRMLAKEIQEKVNDIQNYTLIAIARGGFAPTQIISEELNIQKIYSIGANSYAGTKQGEMNIYQMPKIEPQKKYTLMVDEVVDTGNTMKYVKALLETAGFQITTASIYVKPSRNFEPDFWAEETNKWIVFPWAKK